VSEADGNVAVVRQGPARAAWAIGLIGGGAIVLLLSWCELASVDLGYHLAYGRHWLDTRQIVECDPFIFAARGYRFVNANWLGQVAMAMADRLGGATALVALRTLLIAAAFGGAAWIALRRGAGAAAGIVLAMAAFGAYERFDLRPELFSYACLVGQLGLLVAGPRRIGIAVSGAFALQVLWVNAHSYFLVAPLVSGAWLAGEWLRRLIRPGSVSEEGAIGRAGAILAAQLLACFLNPWFAQGAVFPIRTLLFLRAQGVSAGGPAGGTGGPWSAISEFHSPWNYIGYAINGHTIEAWLVLLAVTGLGLAAAVAIGRWGDAAVIFLLALMSFSMRRNIALFAIGATPLAIGAIVTFCRSRRGLRALAGAAAWSAALVVIAAAGWLGWTLRSGEYYFREGRANRRFGHGWSAFAFPIEACGWLRDHAAVGPRVLADFGSSSNAIPLLPEGWEVYADTNTFAYPPDVLASVQEISAGLRPCRPLLDDAGVNAVLVNAATSSKGLAERLAADREWEAVWFDRAFIVFVRRTPELAPLVEAGAVRPEQLDIEQWAAQAKRAGGNAGWSLAESAGVALALGWYEKAAGLLERATALEPRYGLAWMNLGTAYGQLAMQAGRNGAAAGTMRARLEQAKACFDRALRIDPRDGLAARNLKLAEQGLELLR